MAGAQMARTLFSNLPYMFKKENIGPLVDRTTWGGLVGIWDTPPLIDGGYYSSARRLL